MPANSRKLTWRILPSLRLPAWLTAARKQALRRLVNPLTGSLVVFAVVLALLTRESLHANQGRLVYALDDGYIHMAVAKNLAQHGVWGADRYGFAAASSAPLWTLFLAAVYAVFGLSEAAPFTLNILFAALTLGMGWAALRAARVEGWLAFLLLLAVVGAGALPLLVFVGMEHALQVFLNLLFLYGFGRLAGGEDSGKAAWRRLCLLAALAVGVRYEGVFLVAAGSLILALRKRFGEALGLLLAGCLPILAFGLFSLSQGGLFLPNTILLKGVAPAVGEMRRSLAALIEQRWNTSRDSLELAQLSLAILAALLLRSRGRWDWLAAANLAYLPTSLLQTFFIGNNYFYRYEANLVCAGIILSAAALRELFRRRRELFPNGRFWWLYVIVLGVFAWKPIPHLWQRAQESLEKIVPATTNIYEQQYQMGLFLRQFYQGKTIAANDIGAINYLADIRTVDLYGLSTQAVADLKLARRYDRQAIARLAQEQGVDIAMVYDHWYDEYGGLPRQWLKAGEWKISHNVVCGGDVVSFYAVRQAEAPALRANLRAFSAQLPSSVAQFLR